MYDAFFDTDGKSTSPTLLPNGSPLSVTSSDVPASTIITPSFTTSAVISRGLPTPVMITSALFRETMPPLLLDKTVNCMPLFISHMATGLPTSLPAPTTYVCFPTSEMLYAENSLSIAPTTGGTTSDLPYTKSPTERQLEHNTGIAFYVHDICQSLSEFRCRNICLIFINPHITTNVAGELLLSFYKCKRRRVPSDHDNAEPEFLSQFSRLLFQQLF